MPIIKCRDHRPIVENSKIIHVNMKIDGNESLVLTRNNEIIDQMAANHGKM